MRVTYFNRKFNASEISIEKLFSVIKKSLIADGVIVSEIENPYGNGLLNLLKSVIYFRKVVCRTELVHITGQVHFAAIALKTQNVIITVHDLGIYRKLSPIRFFLFKLFWIYLPFLRAKAIVAISEKTKSEIIEIMPSIAQKILVIPNCLTMEVQSSIECRKSVIPKILIVGTRSNKNIEKAIEALEGLAIEVCIVGKLTTLQLSLLEQFQITFESFHQVDEHELVSLYRQSDFLLFPSIYEGFGLPILEAQANNVIPITSSLPPLDTVGGLGVIYVDPFSVQSIRKGVIEALELSDEERLDYLHRGKQNLRRYEVDNVSKKYLELYKQCIR